MRNHHGSRRAATNSFREARLSRTRAKRQSAGRALDGTVRIRRSQDDDGRQNPGEKIAITGAKQGTSRRQKGRALAVAKRGARRPPDDALNEGRTKRGRGSKTRESRQPYCRTGSRRYCSRDDEAAPMNAARICATGASARPITPNTRSMTDNRNRRVADPIQSPSRRSRRKTI